MPDNIYAIAGEEISIYYDNILCRKYLSDEYDYTVKCNGEGIFEQLEERFRIIPSSEGTYAIDFQVYKNGKLKETKHTLLCVSQAPYEVSSKSVLVIGDSTIANGIMLEKWKENAERMGMALGFVGTQGTGDAEVRHEGISGWTARMFCTDEESPFVFEGKLDFGQYLVSNHVTVPDIVCLNLGINDVFGCKNEKQLGQRVEETLEFYDELINCVLDVNENIIIGISIPIPPTQSQDAFGKANVGQTQWQYKVNIQELQKAIIAKYEEKVDLVPIYINLDTQNAMGVEYCKISSRDNRSREEVPANGHVHPDENGYGQIADEMCAWLGWKLRKANEIVN